MPVGAIVGAAVVGAGATVASGAMASHAQSKAADSAASSAANTAQINNQLARDTYNQNATRLDPYSHMGLAAGDEYMGLLMGKAPTTAGAGSGWAPVTGTTIPATTPAATTPATTPHHATSALGRFLATSIGLENSPAPSALAPYGANSSVAQQAQAAIAAGADPAAVRARAASMGVQL